MASQSTCHTRHNCSQIFADLEKCLHKEQVFPVYHAILQNNKQWIRGLEHRRKYNGPGMYADIYQGIYEGREVCDKQLRSFGSSRGDLSELHANEITTWARLHHPNILPFFGMHINQNRICLVSPWMKNGNLKVYAQKQPYHVKIQLLLGVARGLEYLHSQGIVHWDLKAENILISDKECALIGDFGLSFDINKTFFPPSPGTSGWMAPEVIAIEVPDRKASDIWSFGCLAYEVMEEKKPYAKCRTPCDIFQAQMVWRQTPGEFRDSLLKSLVQSCWDFDPAKRPSATALRHQMEDLYLSTLSSFLGSIGIHDSGNRMYGRKLSER